MISEQQQQQQQQKETSNDVTLLNDWSIELLTKNPFTSISLPKEVFNITKDLRVFHCGDIKNVYDNSKNFLRNHDLLRPNDQVTIANRWNIDYSIEVGDREDGKYILKAIGEISEKNPPNIELQASLAWRKMFESLVNGDIFKERDIPFTIENLVSSWEKGYKALNGVYGKDIFIWLGLQHVLKEKEEKEAEGIVSEFLKYYKNISLKRKLKNNGKYSRDPLNWQVAAALAYSKENDENIFTQYKIKEEKKTLVKEWAEKINNEGLCSLIDKNSRLVGRLVLLEYLQSRLNSNVDIKRSINEVTLMVLLRLSPYDNSSIEWLQKLSETEKIAEDLFML